ncbi:MAG: hypothetical protein ABIA77_04155, partial [Candidatus Omnitrophota bacterium]
AIAKENKLTVYQSDKKAGYIVIMGFDKQVDTTRVGIFFDKVNDSRTKITLSSLSRSALSKASSIFFEGLQQ